MFLSPLLIPNLHPVQASRLPMRSRRAKGQALKTAFVHTNTVSYLNDSARGNLGKKKKKKDASGAGGELGWGVLRQQVKQVTC